MKKPIIIFIVALIVIGGIFLGWRFLAPSLLDSDPVAAVEDFYNKWLNVESSPLAVRVYKNEAFLTERIKNSFDQVISSFDTGGFDPVLCAQDKPSSFKVILISEGEEAAQVEVEEDFSGAKKKITVDLIKGEDGWLIDNIICSDIKRASGGGLSLEAQNLIGNYVRENISFLSPEKEVLGGKFQVTEIVFQDMSSAVVSYEDGHNAYQALVKFTINPPEDVEVFSFEILKKN